SFYNGAESGADQNKVPIRPPPGQVGNEFSVEPIGDGAVVTYYRSLIFFPTGWGEVIVIGAAHGPVATARGSDTDTGEVIIVAGVSHQQNILISLLRMRLQGVGRNDNQVSRR